MHGLTGCAHDFDALAEALASLGYRVVCPDVVGRGSSDWLADPADYELRQYASDLTALVRNLGVPAVDWIGTSMGGLIGMVLAARADSPVLRLVMNDIGPFIPSAALQRLDGYTGSDPTFPDIAAAEAYMRRHYAPVGHLSDAQWRRMAEQRTRPAGSALRLHYDPGIAVNLHATADRDADLWRFWDEIRCPVLLLRGSESDLLLRETVAAMETRGPGIDVVEFADCGHNPPLLERAQIEPVLDWLGPARAP